MSSAPRKRTLLTSLLRGGGDDDNDTVVTTDDDCYYNDEELQQQDDDDDDKKRTRGMLQLLTLILLPLFMLRVSRKLLGRSVAISCLLLFAPLVRFVTLTVDKICQNHLASHKIISPLVSIHRECESPPYETIATAASSKTEDEKTTNICMTTLTDEKHRSRMQQLYGWRNYKNVLETTWPNKKRYADLHGYQLFDESDQLDTSRPPAWSKPLAVKRLFQEEDCDWVIWMDADTVIMNSKKRWQDVLPSASTKADLVITGDLAEPRKNNGVWAIRNSDWSRQFLDEWYNMTTFIAPVGYAYSGDQDAMNELMLTTRNNEHKIVSPVQCTFNSFVHLMEAPTTTAQHYMLMRNLTQQEWYNSPYYYHDGDFIAHAAGVDLKLQVLQDFVKLAK